MISIPFSIAAYDGFASVEGLMSFDDLSLTLEFELKDSVVGLLKSDVKNVQIPVEEIVSIELHKGWFRTRLAIQASTLNATKGIPESSQGRVTLSIARSHRDAVEQLVSRVVDKIEQRNSGSG